MKKTLLIIACFISSFTLAQLPANSLGADFTITDIEGETHNLYDILDEGKTVILDLFATWCGPCWNFADTGVLEDLQNGNMKVNVIFTVAENPDPDYYGDDEDLYYEEADESESEGKYQNTSKRLGTSQ